MYITKKDLIEQLRTPPTMSMALNYGQLYSMMTKLMAQAADELEATEGSSGTKRWVCPLRDPNCEKNCGAYHCGN